MDDHRPPATPPAAGPPAVADPAVPASRPRAPAAVDHWGAWLGVVGLVPGGAAVLSSLMLGLHSAVAGALIVAPATILLLFARLHWIVVRDRVAVGWSLLVSGVVLVPVMILLGLSAESLIAMLEWLMGWALWLSPERDPLSQVALALGRAGGLGLVVGLLFAAMVAAFHYALVPGRMPDEPGWILAHLRGGALAGLVQGLGAGLETGLDPAGGGRPLALMLLPLVSLSYAASLWPVWLRTLRHLPVVPREQRRQDGRAAGAGP